MPTIFGPKNSRYTYTGSRCPHTDLAFSSTAKTLGEAINAYEDGFDLTITPCMSPIDLHDTELKYFVCIDNKTEVSTIVDIHVFRGTDEICPKQNINFELFENDMIEFGELIC